MIIRNGLIFVAFLLMSVVAIAQSGTQPYALSATQSTQGGAPQAGPRRLTLAAAIDAAETNYPRVRTALEQQNAARSAIDVARTAYLPRADVLWQTNRATANNIYGLLLPQGIIPSISGPVLPSDYTRSAWSSAGGTVLSWQPFDFGVRAAQVNVAKQGAQAATYGFAFTKLSVAALTTNA